MHFIPNLVLLAGCAAGLALPALAQIDGAGFATNLRIKYGSPLARQTFRPRPGMEMVVDYAANGNVCRIELPPITPEKGAAVQSTRAIDAFAAELVPLGIRGRELGRYAFSAGLHSTSLVEYEYVTISEAMQGQVRRGVTITFTREQCQDKPVQ